MRTNIVLNDDLVSEAFQYANVSSKRELVELALVEFVDNHRRVDLGKLKGKIKLDPTYHYKKLRDK